MTQFEPVGVAQSERHQEACDACDQRQQIVLSTGSSLHSLEELLPIKDSDPVEEHDEADRAHERRGRRLGRDRPERQAREQHSADVE